MKSSKLNVLLRPCEKVNCFNYFSLKMIHLTEKILCQCFYIPEIRKLTQTPIYSISRQDCAPPHFFGNVRHHVDKHFPWRWIGRGGTIRWAAPSPDLTPLDCVFIETPEKQALQKSDQRYNNNRPIDFFTHWSRQRFFLGSRWSHPAYWLMIYSVRYEWVIEDNWAVSDLSKFIPCMMILRLEHSTLWIRAEQHNHSTMPADQRYRRIENENQYGN